MAISDALVRVTDAARDVLLGVSTYSKPRASVFAADPALVTRLRTMMGGLLAPPTITPTRWYLSDLETAEHLADMGNMSRAAQLMLAARKDGHLAGVLSTRTGGLVRLARTFRGDADIIAELERGHHSRAAFDDFIPPSELSSLAADGLLLGVGVGEFIPVRGRRFPVFVRLEPQHLRFLWAENQWFYQGIAGLEAITPGDGRWVLYTPYGRVSPWQSGLWRGVGQAWIRKQHASLYRDNWEATLAHPARVAEAPQGAAEEQKEKFFENLMAWGLNSVFGMPPGYKATLLESNGRGWESFTKTIEQCNEEFKIIISGQSVTTDGGAGFVNGDLFKSVRADLIKETADTLSHCVNTQMLPTYVTAMHGPAAVLGRPVTQEWDVTPPKDRNSEATAMGAVASAVTQLREALAPDQLEPNTQQLLDRFGIPAQALPEDPALGVAAVGGGQILTGNDAAQDTALNGAQIASLLQIVEAVAQGQIPRDAAVAIIQRAFLVDATIADRLLGSVGAGFTPTTPAAPTAPAAPTTPNTEVLDAAA